MTLNYHKHYNERRSMTLRKHENRFRPWIRPGPHWGAYDVPQPSNRLGRGKSPPFSSPPQRLRRFGLSAFGASILAPSALGLSPQMVNPGTATGRMSYRLLFKVLRNLRIYECSCIK